MKRAVGWAALTLALVLPAATVNAETTTGTLREVRLHYTGGCINQTDTTFTDTVSSSASGSDTKSLGCYGSSGSLTVTWSVPQTTPAVEPGSFYSPPLTFTITAQATWTTPPSPFRPPFSMTVTASNNSTCFERAENLSLLSGTHTLTATKTCTIAVAPSTAGDAALTRLQAGFSAGSSWGFISGTGEATYRFGSGATVSSISPSVAPNTVTEGFFQEPLTATITGEKFASGARVSIGDIAVRAVRVKSATQLEADLGGFANLREGPRDVVVTNPDGSTATGTGLFYVSSLAVAALEVNQGISYDALGCAASRPCIANHRTAVRVRPACNGSGCATGKEATRGTLHVLDAAGKPACIAGSCSPFTAQAAGVPVLPAGTSAPDAERFASTDALNFRLDGLTEGTYDLQFEVDPRSPGTPPPRADKPDPSKNLVRKASGQVFQKSKGRLRIAVVFDSGFPYAALPRAARRQVDGLLERFEYLRDVYPVSADQVTVERVPCEARMPGDDETEAWPALQRCWTSLFIHNLGPISVPNFADWSHVFLFTPQQAFDRGVSFCGNSNRTGFFSCAAPLSIVKLYYVQPDLTSAVIAHEMGHHHALGDTYKDPSAKNPINSPSTCPTSGGDDGCGVEEGSFDLPRGEVALETAPYQKRDFMGNAERSTRWVDLRTWSWLYRKYMGPQFLPALPVGSAPRARDEAPGERIVVAGTVRRNGTGSLATFRRFTGTSPAEEVTDGPFAIELQDAGGKALGTRAFDAIFRAADAVAERDVADFLFTLPYPAGVSKVALKRDGIEIASRRVSVRAPSVRVVSPNGGESVSGTATVTWSASDADGDPLTFDVLYSRDGGSSWLPVATELSGTSFSWDTTQVGGSRSGKVRIVANDGVHSTSDDSDGTFTVPSKAPVATILAPAEGSEVLSGREVVFTLSGYDPQDGALTAASLTLASNLSGAVGQGTEVRTSSLAPGRHTLTLTARNREGATATDTIALTVLAKPTAPPDQTAFVPIVLSSSGVNASFFTSELTLANRGTRDATAELAYTPALGGGAGGSGWLSLPAGRQLVVPDAISYLISLGVPIPPSGNRGGTLRVRLYGLSSPADGSATVRTTTAVSKGRAGLSYPAVPPALLTGPVYVAGLRQTETDRSNLALMNAGAPSDGAVVLRPTLFSGDPSNRVTKVLPDVSLQPGAFTQLSGVLANYGVTLANGYVKVERVSGTAPYYAYGVVNDQVTSDGSYVPPFAENALQGKAGLSVPVVVETAAPSSFSSELVATNWSSARKTVRLSFVADAIATAEGTASFTLELAPGEQKVIPALVQYLRDLRVPGVGPADRTYVGALFATVDGGDAQGIFVGVRTSSPAPSGGRFGLFYAGVPYGAAANGAAWVFGLQQNDANRSNLGLVNTGETDGSTDVLGVEVYDGDTGQLARTLDVTLGPRRFTQLSGILSQNAPQTSNGYVRVTRRSGNNPFIVYGVLNDGGVPGARSDDGAFLVMDAPR